MSSELVTIIRSKEANVRDRSLDSFCRSASLGGLLSECEALEGFRKASENLYEKVRALFFLYAIHRFHLPVKVGINPGGFIPFEGYQHLLNRRFEEAIELFLTVQEDQGAGDAISSALSRGLP